MTPSCARGRLTPGCRSRLLVTAGIYLRRMADRASVATASAGVADHLAAFLGGLAAIFLALASPIEPFAALLLQVHMVQHLLLMMVAPPLFWLGARCFRCCAACRGRSACTGSRRSFARRRSGAFFARLTHPLRRLPLFIATTWLWHVPAALRTGPALGRLALAAARLFPRHGAACFGIRSSGRIPAGRAGRLAAVAVPDPGGRAEHGPVGPADVLRPGACIPITLRSRAWAGSPPWTIRRRPASSCGCPARWRFSCPLFASASGFCSVEGETVQRQARQRPVARRVSLACPESLHSFQHRAARSPGFDLLRVPLLGRFLRWRHARLALQLPLCAGGRADHLRRALRARRSRAMNLAGVVPWIHWRGLADPRAAGGGQHLLHGVSVSVAADACPPLAAGRASWPRRLRSKWLAVALLVLFLWAYEAFALWDSPWLDGVACPGVFCSRPSSSTASSAAPSFCKYLCPIGQFNFVQSLVSPLEVKAREPSRLRLLPDERLHPRPRRHSRLRIASLPAAQGWQHGLHVLSRLRPRLPAR